MADEPTDEDRTMAAVDAALDPALRMCDNIGVVSFSQLKGALISVRQALCHAVYGAPQHPVGEPHDTATEEAAQREADRVAVEQAKADEPPASQDNPFQ